MLMYICIYCRAMTIKKGTYSYLCIDCEKIVKKAEREERQIYLDAYM